MSLPSNSVHRSEIIAGKCPICRKEAADEEAKKLSEQIAKREAEKREVDAALAIHEQNIKFLEFYERLFGRYNKKT